MASNTVYHFSLDRNVFWHPTALLSHITHTLWVIKRKKNNGGMAINDRPINLEKDCWIGKNSKIEKKFNISTNHLHYNKTAVNALMSSNHFKLTILRNPESQFVSSFKVSLQKIYENFYGVWDPDNFLNNWFRCQKMNFFEKIWKRGRKFWKFNWPF